MECAERPCGGFNWPSQRQLRRDPTYQSSSVLISDHAAFFRPKLVRSLAESQGQEELRTDAVCPCDTLRFRFVLPQRTQRTRKNPQRNVGSIQQTAPAPRIENLLSTRPKVNEEAVEQASQWASSRSRALLQSRFSKHDALRDLLGRVLCARQRHGLGLLFRQA